MDMSISCFLLFFMFSHLSLGALTVAGDFRYRHENISQERAKDDARHRMRVRLGFVTSINEKTNFAFRVGTAERLTSGSPSATSNNETLDNAGTKKEFHLDTAYVQQAITPQLAITFGKMENILYVPGKSDLIWDADWTPEGVGFNFLQKTEDTSWFLRGVGYWLDERATQADSGLLGLQIGQVGKISNQEVTYGVGRHHASALKGRSPLVNSTNAYGNSTNGGNYVHNFEINEAFIEISTLIRSRSTSFYFNFASNVPAGDCAYLIGVLSGRLKNPGDLLVNYSYRKIEKDAVIGAITDSDFIGGGTNGKGHKISMAYLAVENTTVSLSHFLAEKDLVAKSHYQRTQLDLNYKF